MCDECYCCGPSWTGFVNIIAAIDLFTAAIQITFETASLGVLSGLLMPFNSSKEMRFNCSLEQNESQYCPWLYDTFQLKDYFIHIEFDTFVVGLAIAAVAIGFVVEGYLFSVLRRGANEKIYKACRKWFNIRIFLLAVLSTGSLAKFVLNVYYPPVDGVLDGFKIYRLFTLIIVYKLMNEVAHTVGVIYIKPPKRPKRGSL